jgi:hypothetical protein
VPCDIPFSESAIRADHRCCPGRRQCGCLSKRAQRKNDLIDRGARVAITREFGFDIHREETAAGGLAGGCRCTGDAARDQRFADPGSSLSDASRQEAVSRQSTALVQGTRVQWCAAAAATYQEIARVSGTHPIRNLRKQHIELLHSTYAQSKQHNSKT